MSDTLPGIHPNAPILTRRSDGERFAITLQARSPDGPVTLRQVRPPHATVNTTNDRLRPDFYDPRDSGSAPLVVAADRIADPISDLARDLFDAYNASTGGKTWDGKDVPPYDVIAQKTPHVARAWEAVARRAIERLSPALADSLAQRDPDPTVPGSPGERVTRLG